MDIFFVRPVVSRRRRRRRPLSVVRPVVRRPRRPSSVRRPSRLRRSSAVRPSRRPSKYHSLTSIVYIYYSIYIYRVSFVRT